MYFCMSLCACECMNPQKADPLVLEVQVSCLVWVLGANTKLGSSARAGSPLLRWASSVAHWLLLLFCFARHSEKKNNVVLTFFQPEIFICFKKYTYLFSVEMFSPTCRNFSSVIQNLCLFFCSIWILELDLFCLWQIRSTSPYHYVKHIWTASSKPWVICCVLCR